MRIFWAVWGGCVPYIVCIPFNTIGLYYAWKENLSKLAKSPETSWCHLFSPARMIHVGEHDHPISITSNWYTSKKASVIRGPV